ncbi:MAG: hypothetical protein ACM3X5_04175 [Bacillota bacterium]
MKAARLLPFAIAALFSSASAVETTQWPPSPETLGHMRALQETIQNPATSKEDREKARAELESLMKSPAGKDRATRDEKKLPDEAQEKKRPARAAIDPFPSVVKPAEGKLPAVPPPPTARLEVIPPPPRPAISPSTGSVAVPAQPGIAIDPRTGNVLHEVPGVGYVDPRTGQFIPR